MENTTKESSEFGKGFVYNLILFAKHMENGMTRPYKDKDETVIALIEKSRVSSWFNGASDHLYELEVPKKWENTEIGEKVNELRSFAIEIGHGSRMMEDVGQEEYLKAVKLTKEIALLIDKELGVNPIKGDFE